MAIDIIGLQILLTALSAVLGAATLLWLQTIYHRIKLLRALEQEIRVNLKGVSNAASTIYIENDESVLSGTEVSDDIYRTIKAETPLLYARMSRGLSPISKAYREIESLKSLTHSNTNLSGDTNDILQDLELLEGHLFNAHDRIKTIQQDSLPYRFYKRAILKESTTPHPSLHAYIQEREDGEAKEVVWRPSGRNSEEQRNAYRD